MGERERGGGDLECARFEEGEDGAGLDADGEGGGSGLEGDGGEGFDEPGWRDG